MTAPVTQTMPAKALLRTRWTLIGVHILLTVLMFVLAFLHDSILWLITVTSLAPMLVYLPAGLWFARRKSGRVWDRAWAEVTYLSVQMGIWMSMIVLGLYFAGPNECARLTYELGRAAAENPELSGGPGLNQAVLDSCDLDTVINVMTCVHFVLMGFWAAYVVYLVHRLPMPSKEGFKCGVTKMLRGEYVADVPMKDVELGSVGTAHTAVSGRDGHGVGDAHWSPRIGTNGSVPPGGTGAPYAPGYTSAGTTRTSNPSEGLPMSAGTLEIDPDLPPAYTTTPSPTDATPRGAIGMDFETYLQVQQTRMNEKLATDRQRRGTPDGNGPRGGGNGQGGEGSGGSRRRRRSA